MLPLVIIPFITENNFKLLLKNEGAKAAHTAAEDMYFLLSVHFVPDSSKALTFSISTFPKIYQQPKLTLLYIYTIRDVIKMPHKEKAR